MNINDHRVAQLIRLFRGSRFFPKGADAEIEFATENSISVATIIFFRAGEGKFPNRDEVEKLIEVVGFTPGMRRAATDALEGIFSRPLGIHDRMYYRSRHA